MQHASLPPGQQLVAAGKWPLVGEQSPRRDDAPWRVHVDGAVSHALTLSLTDLQALPQVEQVVDIHCVTRWSKLGVRFSGVPLAALLERAGPAANARFVAFVARSDRDHSTSLELDDALALNALIALAADGRPLEESHGGPVRVVVPHRYFYKSLKWLERIELLGEDRLGFWESTAGYHNTADPTSEQRYIAAGISKSDARALLASRDISARQLLNLDARGHDLAGLAARGALLRNADFRGCNLRGANFVGANLTNAHLEGADLREARFDGADLEGANLAGADLRGANFSGARLLAATFRAAVGHRQGDVLLDESTRFSADSLEDLTPEEQTYLRHALADAGARS
jgi:DMSO/TMAO reductase YedYZ molybdopterin-dependent catalytic subunit